MLVPCFHCRRDLGCPDLYTRLRCDTYSPRPVPPGPERAPSKEESRLYWHLRKTLDAMAVDKQPETVDNITD